MFLSKTDISTILLDFLFRRSCCRESTLTYFYKMTIYGLKTKKTKIVHSTRKLGGQIIHQMTFVHLDRQSKHSRSRGKTEEAKERIEAR